MLFHKNTQNNGLRNTICMKWAKSVMSRKVLFILLAGILCFAAVPASAQNEPADGKPALYSTTTKSSLWGPRFEVLVAEGEISPSLFKVDKFTGDVWVLSKSIGLSNKLMKFFRETDIDDDVVEGQINYQLIVVSSSQAYLLNLNTGVMWEYTEELFRKSKSFKVLGERF
jgi:hypothetical protein